ncbi:MAG TPA: hypothetical protein VG986_01565 [Pseudolabrys sp.]|nr:hypothetical protein [Pseudolabrys sp.]
MTAHDLKMLRDYPTAVSPSQGRAAIFTPGQIAVLAGLMLVVASIPIWTNPLPPLSDYVNHLARMKVISAIGNDPNLARFYEIDWQVVPNLMMDLIVPVLARVVTIYHAGQIFLFMMFALIVSGTLAFHRALFGRWSVFPLLALPLLYNHVFLVGLTNFLFGIGLALWALAAWVYLRDRYWLARFAVSQVFVLLLFFCHLSALGVYGVGLLAFESYRLWERRNEPWPGRLVAFVATGFPFLPALPLLFLSPTMRLVADNYWERLGKIDGLIYAIEVYSDFSAFALLAIVIAGAVWAARRNLLRLHPLFWVMLAVCGAVYMAMPRVAFDTYMADQRLPIAFAFMLIACADLDLRHRIVRHGFLALLVTTLLVRVIEVDVSWAGLSTSTSEFRASVKRIKPGARVLVAYAKGDGGDDVAEYGLVHAACLAIIERSALVTTVFSVKGKQVLHVRPDYRSIVDTEDGTPPTVSRLLVAADKPSLDGPKYWDLWPQHYDYVYVLFTESDADNPDPAHLTLLQDGTNFQLYRVKGRELTAGPVNLPGRDAKAIAR